MSTTEVVNLLHLRSLNPGEVPINLAFGQMAINAFNVESPVLPELRETSLFIGTGGNQRVDEDGTDRTADAVTSASFTGEALQLNQGWVRYELRKFKVTGDTIIGELNVSGTKVRFNTGTTGNAELVLPSEFVAVTGEAGSIRYNTVSMGIEIHDGTNWTSPPDVFIDFQTAAVPPALRSDGTALVNGDLYYNSSLAETFIYQGSWVETGGGVHFESAAIAPTTRSNGYGLRQGDLWYDSSYGRTFWYDTGTTSFVPSHTHTFVQAGAPAIADSYQGDIWVNTTNYSHYVFDAGAWTQLL